MEATWEFSIMDCRSGCALPNGFKMPGMKLGLFVFGIFFFEKARKMVYENQEQSWKGEAELSMQRVQEQQQHQRHQQKASDKVLGLCHG